MQKGYWLRQHRKILSGSSSNLIIRPTGSAALSWDSCMLSLCALPGLTTILRQNGVCFPPPPSATTCISPDFFPRGKLQSELEFYHNFGASKARNLCTGKKPRAQKAPIYGPSELSLFAEETILNDGGRHNVHEIYQAKTDYSG